MTKNYTFLKIANTVAFIATVAVNILANVLPIGGMNTGQISAMYPTLFTPPAFTFGIWGVIYGLLAVFILTQLFAKSMTEVHDIGIFFILSCVLNILWIFTWHNQMIVPSTLLIIALLGTLMKIYSVTRDSAIVPRITFSIYYAWITVATMISLFVLVKTLTGNAPVTPIEPRARISDPNNFTNILIIGGNPEIVSYVSVFEYVMATIAVGLTALITILHIKWYGDYFYVGTILWAVGGIMFKQITAPVQPTLMLIAALIAITVILIMAAKHMIDVREYRRRYKYTIVRE